MKRKAKTKWIKLRKGTVLKKWDRCVSYGREFSVRKSFQTSMIGLKTGKSEETQCDYYRKVKV